MTLRDFAIAGISGGLCSIVAWNAGIKEGLARAARAWAGRR